MFRSLNTKKFGSVGQRAAKLLASNFKNDSTPVRVEPGQSGSSGAGAGQQTFS